MAIDTAPSQVATSALQAIPFGSIIGGPLKACIEAQAMAAQTSWQFIQEVGLNTNPETGQKEAVNVSFQFIQNGRVVQLNVPLLTIVPIPYIAIQNIDINFKGLLRTDVSAQIENYNKMFNIGVYSINEIRGMEDLEPVEGGDVHYVPVNLASSTTITNGTNE